MDFRNAPERPAFEETGRALVEAKYLRQAGRSARGCSKMIESSAARSGMTEIRMETGPVRFAAGVTFPPKNRPTACDSRYRQVSSHRRAVPDRRDFFPALPTP
jgi:hypothetical protein